MRSLDKHAQLLEELDCDNGTKSTEHGINGRSVLMDLSHFDVCQCLVPDVMHDILEGSLQLELKLLLKHCIINKRYFTVSEWMHL